MRIGLRVVNGNGEWRNRTLSDRIGRFLGCWKWAERFSSPFFLKMPEYFVSGWGIPRRVDGFVSGFRFGGVHLIWNATL
jgi:hypothetical protein